jgi:hypothetical protein
VTTRHGIQTKAGRRRSGFCFGRISVAADRSRLPTAAPECAGPHGQAREGARDGHSRLRRFERSCSWTVLIAEVDERRLACHRTVTGLVSPMWRCERASEAGSRRQSRETVAGSPRSLREQVEGALVDGRRSGLSKQPSLTRRRWKRVWRPAKVGAAKAGPEVAGCDRSVRGYVASSDRGRKHRGRGIPPEGPSIAAPARTERYLVRAMLGVAPGYRVARRCASRAEAGGSPSSDAPPR